MFSYGPPWKQAVIGAVAVIAGLALLLIDWTLAQLVAFVAMFFVGRGALHLVTMTFEGVSGALSALLGCAEIGIGVLLLAWPNPTLLVLAAAVGGLVLVRGIVHATVVLATRAEQQHWALQFGVGNCRARARRDPDRSAGGNRARRGGDARSACRLRRSRRVRRGDRPQARRAARSGFGASPFWPAL